MEQIISVLVEMYRDVGDIFGMFGKCLGHVSNFRMKVFAGAARRAGPDSMLILCLSVCVSEIISRPLIGRKLATSPDVVRRS